MTAMNNHCDPLELLLTRLHGMKTHGERHVARCPAHQDKSPSLSLSRGQDGRVLVHCHAGCETRDVLAAVGLELKDLFPENLSREQRQQYRREQLEKERHFERLIVESGNGALAKGTELSDEDVARMALAQERIERLDRQLAEPAQPEPPTVEPERPCWGVYEGWVRNEKGARLKPGVYWHGYRRTQEDAEDGQDDERDRPVRDDWIATPVFVEARTLNSDDGTEGRLLRWDMTKGGLEIEAASRNDTLLSLDEIKRADPRRVQEMAYALANGQGKGTMTREREGRAKLHWRLLTLSSGERSLSEHAAIGGNPAHAGAELRMVDVNAGTRTHRAFDELHGMEGADFHRALTVAAGQHYGHLGPAFVERLIAGDDRDGLLEDFARVRACFVVENAQAGRVADRFAVIALAGEMARAYGLLPWPAGTSLADSQLLYREWLERVGSGNAEDRQILAGIARFIERHGDSRFSSVDAGETDSRVTNRAGYWEDEPGRRLYLFNTSGLTEAAHGFGLTRITKALDTAGAIAKHDIEKGQKRNTKKYRIPGSDGKGRRPGFYVIDPDRLEADADGEPV